MRLKIGWVLISVVLFVAAFSLPAHVRLGQEDEEAAWLKSGDPCFPTKQKKAFIKMDMSYITCIPISIKLNWDVEETYQRTGRYGTDRVKLKLEESYPGYLELIYNQKNRTQLESYEIRGPSPCCPGNVTAGLDINASFLVCGYGPSGTECRPYSTSRPMDFVVTPRTDSFFGIYWCRDAVSSAGSFESSTLGPIEGLVNEPLSIQGDVFEQCSSGFSVLLRHNDLPTWEDIKEGLESGEFRKEFSFHDRTFYPRANHVHAVEGKVLLSIQSGVEYENWLVNVEGWEIDKMRPPITYKAMSQPEKKLPIQVTFDWKLQGKFRLVKIKKSKTYESGTITQAALTPTIVFNSPDLYRCYIASSKGEKTPYKILSLLDCVLEGKLSGNFVQLTWPPYPSEAYVICTPQKTYLGKVPYQQQFGSEDFMFMLSRERLPLKDGAIVTGGLRGATELKDWLQYKITLKKIS